MSLSCSVCEYTASNKSCFTKHLKTKKHAKMTALNLQIELPENLRVLVSGARLWTNEKIIHEKLGELNLACLIQGDCEGADIIAKNYCENEKIEVLSYPAQWKEYGKKAGVVRNQQMIDEGQPDVCLAFHEKIEDARGTKDMIKRCLKCGIPVVLVSSTETVNNQLKIYKKISA